MENHPIENLLKSTMENLKDMIDVNTIVGDPIKSEDGTLVIPISKVSLGFASGGSEFCSKYSKDDKLNHPFGGGTGSGITVKPVAFLVLKDDTIRLLPMDQNTTYDKIVDQIPQIIDMIKNIFKTNIDNKSNTNYENNEE